MDKANYNLEYIDVRELHQNPDNPRQIGETEYRKLRASILLFDKMLRIRPLVHKDGEVVGGNMRLKSLQWIAQATKEDVCGVLDGIDAWDNKTEEQKEALLEKWSEWQKNPTAPTLSAYDFNEDELREFIAKDNIEYGRWVNRILKTWNQKALNDWGAAIKKVKDTVDSAGEYPFTEVLNESHNYVVLYFDNEVDWLQAKTLLGIKKVRRMSTKRGSLNSKAYKLGEGRVLKGAEAINRLLGIKNKREAKK